MKTAKLFSILTLAFSLLFSASLPGQEVSERREFTLFDDPADKSATTVPGGPGNGERISRAAESSPTFSLVGTARIGSKKSATLKHQSGKVIRVPIGDSSMPIPGYASFSVVNHGPGRIAVRNPASIPCTSFPGEGVNCDAATNTSWLSLITAAAISRPREAEPVSGSSDIAVADEAPDSETQMVANSSRNPFTALRDRNAGAVQDEAARVRRRQPQRIAPEDVPPGMRLVSTPFGDRLIKQ